MALLAGEIADDVSDEIKAELERGSVFATANVLAEDASVLGVIQSDGQDVFRVYLKNRCNPFLNQLNQQ